MKWIIFFVVSMISVFMLFIVTPINNTSADWLTGYNMARDSSNLPESYAGEVVFAVLQWLLLVFTFLSVIAFIITGIMFLTAGSNPDMATNAKKSVAYSIIGIAIGLSGYVIVTLIDVIMKGRVQEISG